MSPTVADRLADRRRRAFVGRAEHLGAFGDLLTAPELPVVMLHVHGPAGVGKSTLLRRYAELAEELGVPAVLLDARELPLTPTELAATVAAVTAGLGPGRSALLLDTFELLAGVDQLLRDQLLPGLPVDCLVVTAGQHPLPASWRTDLGWSALVRELPLDNFTAAESDSYLRGKEVAADRFADAVSFTRGHPLALALVSEVLRQHGTFNADESPDVIQVLVERLVQVVPSADHRRALAAGSQVRVVTEPLLAAMLADSPTGPDVGELFAWLRRLALVQARPAGLFVHDLARQVLAADLRWRDPALYAAVHDRARAHYLARLAEPDPAAQAAALMDLMFLHPDLRQFIRPPDTGGLAVGPARDDDVRDIPGLVGRHEGPESAALAAAWLHRQPGAWQVVRDSGGRTAGLLCTLSLADADTDGVEDPGVRACRAELARHAPLRPGESAIVYRWWLAAETYQDISPVQSLIAVQMSRHWLSTPGLALSMITFAAPQAWTAFAAYADQHRWPGADFAVDGRTYGVYGHDWRVVTPTDWLAGLAVRETGQQVAATPLAEPRLLVLDREQFAAGVRRALKDLHRPDRLRDNPLLRSRLVTGVTTSDAPLRDRVVALQRLVKETIAVLQEAPVTQDRHSYRVLHRAYLAPAATLEKAAEALHLPSSTFRRHLAEAVDRVVEELWARELAT